MIRRVLVGVVEGLPFALAWGAVWVPPLDYVRAGPVTFLVRAKT